ncbi:MAG: hypothetical protein WC455_07235 [Dehalococcoidia bacterium]|jgi:hypothetical protein
MTRKHDSEQLLVDDFTKVYGKTLQRGEGVLILNEIKTAWGIVDILAIHYNKAKLLKRCESINKMPPVFSNLSAYAMVYLSENPVCTVQDLGNYLKTNNGPLSQVLETLRSRGLINIYKNGNVRICTKDKTFVIKDILAFEAKISKWKRAVEQAERYLWFTNSSYIIVPNFTSSTINAIRLECANRGIGLIVQSRSKSQSFRIIKEPLYKVRIDSFFSWKLNELLIDRSISNGRKHPS